MSKRQQPTFFTPIRGLVSSELQNILARPHPQDQMRTNLQVICEKIVEQAAEGNLMATNMIFDRVEGKPMQQMDINTALQLLAALPIEEIAAASGIPVSSLKATKLQYLEATNESPPERLGETSPDSGGSKPE